MSAFAALLSSNKYVRDAALGNSEPMLAAVVLWGFERHLDGRRDHALYLGVAAALLRPEAWPFLGLYGIWLWFYEPELRKRLVFFVFFVPACWILPEWWGAHDPFRAGSRANAPNPGSAAFAAHPAWELFKRFAESTVAPGRAGDADRRRRGGRRVGANDGSRAPCSRWRRSASRGSRSWR